MKSRDLPAQASGGSAFLATFSSCCHSLVCCPIIRLRDSCPERFGDQGTTCGDFSSRMDFPCASSSSVS